MNDVHADHCTLDWKPPDDDGGIPIENYVIEKLDTATGRWVPAVKVSGDQTSAVVDGLIPGHEYKASLYHSDDLYPKVEQHVIVVSVPSRRSKCGRRI